MYDVFISYRREGGHEMARLLYEHFNQMGLNPFFDLEELKFGPFNTKLYKIIEESANFVLVLSANSLDRCKNEDDWVRLEIEHAIATEKNIIPIMMPGFSWPQNLPKSMENLPNYNGIQMSREYFDASISRIFTMLIGVNPPKNNYSDKTSVSKERTENTYFEFGNEKEKRRLKIQQNLMKDFDASTYEKAIEAFDDLYILDIGSNNGDFIMERIGKNSKVRILIGLESDTGSVDEANKKYGVEGKISFYNQNVESDDLQAKITDILETAGIEHFNIINISMVLLHLKTPYRLLKVLRKFLAKDGLLIIKDIDDGLNLAYPDENGNFARIIDICAKNDTSGYRYSGRQIYTLLKHAGYTNISLEKMGISTIGMDYDERSALFDTYFSFILEDLKIMAERYPNDKRIRNDYDWYSKNYEKMEECFQDDAFFFNLGFIMYLAKKH